MDSLTSFLLSEHAELSLDAYTDNMLANLPHQPRLYDAMASIVPFGSQLNKAAGFASPTDALDIKYQPLEQQPADPLMPLPWDYPLPGAPSTGGVPLDVFNLTSEPLPVLGESQPFTSTAAPPASQPASPPAAAALQHGGNGSGSSASSERRGGDPDIAKLHERIQKQKEKNARNQRQFRKRAKEKAVMIEEQVQQLTAKLQDIEMEKRSLIARNKVLEAALSSAKDAKTNMSSPLALAIASTSQDPSLFETVVVRKGDGGTLKLTVQQLQKMTWTELSSIWKEYINAIAMALVTSNNSLDGISGQRLQELVDEVHLLMRGVAMHNASLIHQHLSRRMDVHSLQEQQPAPGFFSNIIEMMQLSKEQKEQILAHRHIKLVSLARLVQERKELQARLKACNEATANPVENVPCLGLGAEFPHLLEVTERLNENVAQLHRSVCLFMGQIWRQVLTPLQAGIFMVQAFPWAPDMLALANALAERAGAPTVKQIFDEVLSSSATNTPLQLTLPSMLLYT